jgi:hypothetical protein
LHTGLLLACVPLLQAEKEKQEIFLAPTTVKQTKAIHANKKSHYKCIKCICTIINTYIIVMVNDKKVYGDLIS